MYLKKKLFTIVVCLPHCEEGETPTDSTTTAITPLWLVLVGGEGKEVSLEGVLFDRFLKVFFL